MERKSSDKLQRRVMFSDHSRPGMLDCDVQTDIAQFQIDEIMLRLFSLQVFFYNILYELFLETSGEATTHGEGDSDVGQ